MFDCRLFIEKYPGWEVMSRLGLAGGSMGEQQQQQLRDAMRTFGVVFFYGPTVLQSYSPTVPSYTLTSLQTCRETMEEIFRLLCSRLYLCSYSLVFM